MDENPRDDVPLFDKKGLEYGNLILVDQQELPKLRIRHCVDIKKIEGRKV